MLCLTFSLHQSQTMMFRKELKPDVTLHFKLGAVYIGSYCGSSGEVLEMCACLRVVAINLPCFHWFPSVTQIPVCHSAMLQRANLGQAIGGTRVCRVLCASLPLCDAYSGIGVALLFGDVKGLQRISRCSESHMGGWLHPGAPQTCGRVQ